ncbi:MAG: response regulator [Alphaproteobacteria bacterium]|nr:response regulator [Alphaproteobacteria bacterium]MDE2112045.1 response regulator [Alphaproteobacteria bacterium]MDE2492429.1 response regulator [Alphaproteobacteria bacterium]
MDLTIDLVDDDDAVRDSLRALLESYGYAVRDYASAESYLRCSNDRPGDCVIVDHHMPEMTGLELLEDLRAHGDDIPAIILTGRYDPSLEQRVAQVKVVALLHKPVNDEHLVNCIKRACASTGVTP